MDPGTALYLFTLIASIAISYVLTPKPTTPTAATLDDFEFPQADEGTPQIVVFGDVWISGWTVLTYGNLVAKPIEAKGGKK